MKTAKQTVLISLLGNIVLALLKAITGFLGNSYALIADAIESTTDVFASLLVLFGIKYSNRPADENHPYGHGKAEPLVTFMVVAFLVVSAAVIVHESIQNIRIPHEPPKSWTLYFLGAIVVWKESMYRIVIRKSKEIGSTTLKAEAWHHRSDAITSVLAFLGILISVLTGGEYAQADDWAALLASVFILYNCYKIFRPALGEIMDEHQYDELVQKIRELSVEVDGVTDTEKCFVRKSGINYYVDLHVIVDGEISVREGHRISHELKDHLQNEISEISQVLIHVEPHELY